MCLKTLIRTLLIRRFSIAKWYWMSAQMTFSSMTQVQILLQKPYFLQNISKIQTGNIKKITSTANKFNTTGEGECD